MIGLIIRIIGVTLGVCFIGWWFYISWLGIKMFFSLGNKNNKNNKNNK